MTLLLLFLTFFFSAAIRYSGVSVSYSIGAALIGGLSPSFLPQSYTVIPNSLNWYLIITLSIMLMTLRY
ncbi:MAG: hypothetical protein ACD_29C00107G0007 [uncultured bacterium]|nr:MAG: hypothetical protein ACD_29C00107G0007 [uncultured bacterium]